MNISDPAPHCRREPLPWMNPILNPTSTWSAAIEASCGVLIFSPISAACKIYRL